ncbi:HEPN domain-containing protein [Tissierella praeacuta]|uniref:HEPN domain-containing protein n=1 Tax=Tissierella praeacuta TaxID=43131 RepID=UPI003341DB0E
MVYGLEQKTNCSKEEQKLYKALTEELYFPPLGIKLTNYIKFNSYLSNLFNFKVVKGSPLDIAIENYLEITKYRNKIIHYSDGSYTKVYDTEELKKCINSAPVVIQTLFDELYNVSLELVNVGYPNWFKDRKSKEI